MREETVNEAHQYRLWQYGQRQPFGCDRQPGICAHHGRRTRAVIITDSDHVILTYLQSETVANRLNDDEDEIDTEEGAPDDE